MRELRVYELTGPRQKRPALHLLVRKAQQEVMVWVVSVQFDDGPVMKPALERLWVRWVLATDGRLSEVTQILHSRWRRGERLNAAFSAESNETELYAHGVWEGAWECTGFVPLTLTVGDGIAKPWFGVDPALFTVPHG